MCAFRTSCIVLLTLLLFTTPCFGQKENNIWYFGYGVGLDFNTSPPTPLADGRINTNEGAATVCDHATGRLLFYTDGITVWNRNHLPMKNGTGLAGSPSSTQSALIVRSPCDTFRYYVFTSGDLETDGYMGDGYKYSEIDMRLDGGNGEVVGKNVLLHRPGTEKLTAVRHGNAHDIWVVTHRAGDDLFYAYKVSANGITLSPVVSGVGPPLNGNRLGVVGALRASPDGRRLAMATEKPSAAVQVFRFDDINGIVAEPILLSLPDPAYGICFSPNSLMLYATVESVGTYQFDLSSGDAGLINASRTLIDNRGATGDLELGPDGRIYVATVKDHLDVILDPDQPGPACRYQRGMITLGKEAVRYGIQNRSMVSTSNHDMLLISRDTVICAGGPGAALGAIPLTTSDGISWTPSEGLSCTDCPDPIATPSVTTTYTTRASLAGCMVRKSVTVTVFPQPKALVAPDTALCEGDSARIGRDEPYPEGTSFSWEPKEGLDCSDCPNPWAKPSVTTRYSLTVVGQGGCNDVASVLVSVGSSTFADAGPDKTVCVGDGTTLNGSGGDGYLWSPAEGLNCTDCAEPVASPTKTTLYRLRAVRGGRCFSDDSVTVTVLERPKASIEGPAEIFFCGTETVQLRASGGTSYRWSPGTGLSCVDCPDPTASPSVPTRYTVTVSNDGGCVDSASVTVHPVPPPPVDAGMDVSICPDGSIGLHASGAVTYRWEPAAGLSCTDCPDPIAAPSATTTYIVTGTGPYGCEGIDSVRVAVLPVSRLEIKGDTTICRYSVAYLRAPTAGRSHQWSPTEGLSCPTCAETEARPGTSTTYTVTMILPSGCIASGTVRVEVDPRSVMGIARIDRKYRVAPGDDVQVPITLEEGIDDAKADRIVVGLTYRPDVVRLKDLSTAGGLLEGWKVVRIDEDTRKGSYTIELAAPAGETIRGIGTLLTGTFTGFIGASDSSEIGLTIEVMPQAPCTGIVTFPGLIRLDSICGLAYRLIESTTENFALLPNHPNPFNPTTEIPFSIGLDGPVTLEIHDASGRRVAALMNEVLQPGEYIATWDASDLPSGIYYVRLTCGTWSRSRAMMLVR